MTPYSPYGEIAPGGEWPTGIVWCCPKKVYTLGPLEDTVMIQFTWGLFFFFSFLKRSFLTTKMLAGCPKKNSGKNILFGKNW